MIENAVRSSFRELFGKEQIMVFSPGRLNIIGEHTDYNEGFVFPAAIDKGIYAAFAEAGSDHCSIHALDLNDSFEFSINDISVHPEKGWVNYIIGVVGEMQKLGLQPRGFRLVFSGDIPEGAGLSSSAALENSIAFGLNELFSLNLKRLDMIRISQKAEHNYVGVKCGIMDQFASMFGQAGKALWLDCRSIEATPYPIDLGNYQLLLINTNVKHSLADSAYNDRRAACEQVSKLLGISALRDATESDLEKIAHKIDTDTYHMALYVIQENERTALASKAMEEGQIEQLGELLIQGHMGLKNQYKVSCPELDFLVDMAIENDHVLGARMMGGGFGGCTINIVSKEHLQEYKSQVEESYRNEFTQNCSFYEVSLSDGTHLVK